MRKERKRYLKGLKRNLFLIGGVSAFLLSTPLLRKEFSSYDSVVSFEEEANLLQVVWFQIEGSSFFQLGYFYENEDCLYFQSVLKQDVVYNLTDLSLEHLVNIYYANASNFSLNEESLVFSEEQIDLFQDFKHTDTFLNKYGAHQFEKETDLYREEIIRKVLKNTSKK